MCSGDNKPNENAEINWDVGTDKQDEVQKERNKEEIEQEQSYDNEKKSESEDYHETETKEEESKKNQSDYNGIKDFIKSTIGKEITDGNFGNVIILKNLNFIENNSGFVVGDQADIKDISIHGENEKAKGFEKNTSNKKSIISTKEELINFLTTHYNDFEMAFLISLSVFNEMPYLWVYEIAEELYKLMEGETEEREKEQVPSNQRIEMIGGIKYYSGIHNHTGWLESEFVCFEKAEDAKRVLECVWSEFIFLREKIIKWLKIYVFNNNYTKTVKAINALAELAIADFYYFDKNIISYFLHKKNLIADFAIAHIMIQVYQDDRYKSNIEKQYRHWAVLGNVHYSLVVLMMCVKGKWEQDKVQIAVAAYIDNVLEELLNYRENGYLKELTTFFVIGERKAVYFKAIVSVLYDKMIEFSDRKSQNKKRMTALIFFFLLLTDDMQSHVDINNKEKHKDMIFIKMCLIKNDITPKLLYLWKYIWKTREFHKLTQQFLEDYLYQYGGCKQEDINYLRQFLYSFQDSKEDKESINYFLQRISLRTRRPVRTAERINYKPKKKQ